MKRIYHLLFLFLIGLPVTAAGNYGYSEERPLVVVCDWDFRPFEFLDAEGKPAGYNIEVLDLILNTLDVPHRFVMQEWSEASRMFESHEADLIHSLSYNFRERAYYKTQKYVNYYSLRVARHSDTPPLHHIRDLDSTNILGIKRFDYASLCIDEMGKVPFKVEYYSPKDALMKINERKLRYYMWGEIPMARKLDELHLDSIVLDDIDIPAGELRFVGHNAEMVNIIDDEYTRLEQDGELRKIYDKWFHPELEHDDASPVSLLVLIGVLVVGGVVFLLSRLAAMRARAAVRHNADLNNMMTQALAMGKYHVLEYDIQTGRIRNFYNKLVPEEGISEEEFLTHFRPDEVEDFHNSIISMKNGDVEEWTLQKYWNKGTPEQPDWHEYYGSAILERENGEPRYIFHTFRDITDEVVEEKRNRQLGVQYMLAFDTNLMAMSFYDAKGRLVNLNQKMRELCEFNEESERYFRSHRLFDDPFVRDFFSQNSRESYHTCGHMCYPELGIDKYIESSITPIFDEDNHLVYYGIASRDVTAERDMYMNQREHDRQLQTAHETMTRYDDQLRYLLEESNMFVWKFSLQEHTIRFGRSLRRAEFVQPLDEYYAGMTPEHREEGVRILHEYVEQGKPFTVIHEFDQTPLSKDKAWHSISGIPIPDKDGIVREYFGIARDITELMSAQQKLREETARAEDSGRLKSAFLANMTHEIRTPLNAIVGFSDLLQMIEAPEERRQMIKVIHDNCDMLLRLINDMLVLSNVDSNAMQIVTREVDFAREFDNSCVSLAQRIESPAVEFRKDNPYASQRLHVDYGRIQQVLTNFVTNAVKYTQQGHITVGYRMEERNARQGIRVYCEDTGTGIPADQRERIFERFVKLNDYVQGTGLGLSICKVIIEKCGGVISVDSEEGKGSTFWFWIPVQPVEG